MIKRWAMAAKNVHGLVMTFALVIATGSCRGRDEIDSPSPPPTPTPIVAAELEPGSVEAGAAMGAEPKAGEEAIPLTRGSGACEVTIRALLEAEEYRGGGPMTPALEASLSSDPDFARMYEAESHGDHHIQCLYQVELTHEPGKRYRWRHVISNTLREFGPEICAGLAAEVADDIISTTRDCSDHAAGAYWGYVLEPLP